MTTNPKDYVLTPEHKAQLEPWAKKWVGHALNTEPMSDEDRDIVIGCLDGLYKVAKYQRPDRVLFLPSVLQIRLVGGYAAAIIFARNNPTEFPSFSEAKPRTTHDRGLYNRALDILNGRHVASGETYSYFSDGGKSLPIKTDDISAGDLTILGTFILTLDKNAAPLKDGKISEKGPVEDLKFTPRGWAIPIAERINKSVSSFQLSCARSSWRMLNMGNLWPSWPYFVSFFKEIAGLDLPSYDEWLPYEKAAIHGGPRIMHPNFTIFSERPELLHIDEQQRHHTPDFDVASHRWRDGLSYYHWHGVRMPQDIMEDRTLLTAKRISEENNQEVRRCLIEIYGLLKYFKDIGANLVSEDEFGKLWTANVDGETWKVVEVINGSKEPDGTYKTYTLDVSCAEEELGWSIDTPHAAVAATYGMKPDEYAELKIRT